MFHVWPLLALFFDTQNASDLDEDQGTYQISRGISALFWGRWDLSRFLANRWWGPARAWSMQHSAGPISSNLSFEEGSLRLDWGRSLTCFQAGWRTSRFWIVVRSSKDAGDIQKRLASPRGSYWAFWRGDLELLRTPPWSAPFPYLELP